MRFKSLGFIILIVMSIISCEKYSLESLLDESTNKNKTSNISFDVFFNDQPSTKSESSVIETGDCDKVDFSLFRIEDCDSPDEALEKLYDSKKTKWSLFARVEQTSDEADFGSFNIKNIPYGVYAAIAIAHSNSTHAVIHSPISADFNGNVPDTYCASKILFVCDTTTLHQILDLNQITCRLNLKYHRETDNDIKTMMLQTTGGSTSFNPLTGYSAGSVISNREMIFDITTDKQDPSVLSFNTFIPSDDSKLVVIAIARNANDDVEWSVPFSNIMMNKNTTIEKDINR